MTRRILVTVVAGIILIAAAVVAMMYERPDPARDRLELVQIGMTHDGVELAMDAAPSSLFECNGLETLTFDGRTGVAEVYVRQATRRVVGKEWVPHQESNWLRFWRWAFGPEKIRP